MKCVSVSYAKNIFQFVTWFEKETCDKSLKNLLKSDYSSFRKKVPQDKLIDFWYIYDSPILTS